MSEFNHILFPVDFSARCRSVRPFANALARQFRSKLTLLHVVEIPTAWYAGMDGGYPIVIDVPAMEAEAAGALNKFLEEPDAVETIVKSGDPASEIIQFAEQSHADLILMPTHGYGKFRSLLLGSVAAKVLHDAECPVWTATHTESLDLAKHVVCKSIMGALDLNPGSVALIQRYASLAREFGAKLRLVHAVPAASVDPQPGFDQEFVHALLQSAREKIVLLQAEAGTDLEACVGGGPVSRVVRDEALTHDADLIFRGRGIIQERFGQLRSNAYAIIRDAPCPVLSL